MKVIHGERARERERRGTEREREREKKRETERERARKSARETGDRSACILVFFQCVSARATCTLPTLFRRLCARICRTYTQAAIHKGPLKRQPGVGPTERIPDKRPLTSACNLDNFARRKLFFSGLLFRPQTHLVRRHTFGRLGRVLFVFISASSRKKRIK